MKLLIIVLITMGPLLVGYALGVRASRNKSLNRDERKELKSNENLIDTLQAIAAQHSITEPNVTAIILDEINTHKRKELV